MINTPDNQKKETINFRFKVYEICRDFNLYSEVAVLLLVYARFPGKVFYYKKGNLRSRLTQVGIEIGVSGSMIEKSLKKLEKHHLLIVGETSVKIASDKELASVYGNTGKWYYFDPNKMKTLSEMKMFLKGLEVLRNLNIQQRYVDKTKRICALKDKIREKKTPKLLKLYRHLIENIRNLQFNTTLSIDGFRRLLKCKSRATAIKIKNFLVRNKFISVEKSFKCLEAGDLGIKKYTPVFDYDKEKTSFFYHVDGLFKRNSDILRNLSYKKSVIVE